MVERITDADGSSNLKYVLDQAKISVDHAKQEGIDGNELAELFYKLALAQHGYTLVSRANRTKASYYASKGLKIGKDHRIRYKLFQVRGLCFDNAGQKDKALANFKKSIGEAKQTGDEQLKYESVRFVKSLGYLQGNASKD